MKLNQKNLTVVMADLYECDKESYNDLWKAITVLRNLDLVDENLAKAMVNKDHELWEIENIENA